MASVDAYLPSLAAARDAKIAMPDAKPVAQERLCGLVVRARVLRREHWSELQDLSHPEHEELKANELPLEGKPGAAYHVIGDEMAHTEHWIRCRVDHYFDKLVELDETWAPSPLRSSTLHRFEAMLEWSLTNKTLPDALRCLDLTPRSVGGAYRSAQEQRPPDFHGFEFGDALRLAETAVNDLLSRGEALHADIRAWAWPVLLVRYDAPEREFALFFDPQGGLHAMGGLTGAVATE